jgi:two-component system response regulator YesN
MDSRIQVAVEFISSNLHKTIKLADVSQAANLSQSRFCELFKKETGHTFSEFIRGKRINKACRLLKKASLSIKQIAYEVGYHHECNFCRDFRRAMNITPSDYRIQQRSFHVSFHVQRMIWCINRLIGRFAYIFVRYANKK